MNPCLPHQRRFIWSRRLWAVTIITAFIESASVNAQDRPQLGILGREATTWAVSRWLNLPAGKTSIDIGDYKGKTLYLYGFQSWCPGCHAHGFPTLQKIIERFGDDPKVGIVAIQTTFEGFGTNTFDRAKEVAKRYGLKIPVGQSGSAGVSSVFMRNYRTGGTPWTVIVGPDGVVRYNDFHIEASEAIRLIESLSRS